MVAVQTCRKRKELILQLPPVTLSSTRLWLSIQLMQSCPNFLSGKGHISCCTTIPGPNILPKVIALGYVTFYQISTIFVFINILVFHYWQNVLCGQQNVHGLACRTWSPGRSLEIYNIDCEVEWWQHTLMSKSKTTMNGCDVTSPTRTQLLCRNTVTWRLITGSLQHRAAAILSTAFHEEPGFVLYRGRRNKCILCFFDRLLLWRTVAIWINLLVFVKTLFFKVMQLCKPICSAQTSRCCFERYELVWTTAKAFVTWRHCAWRMICDVKLSGKPILHRSFEERWKHLLCKLYRLPITHVSAFESPFFFTGISLIFNCEVIKTESSDQW